VGVKIKYHVRKRLFLNRDYDMTAFAVGVVQDTRDIPTADEEAWKWGEIDLMLSDCSRKIVFSFNLNNPESRADALFKIRRIADVVNAVKSAIEIEAKSISKRKPPKKKEEKAE
jgi:hypothetical protein